MHVHSTFRRKVGLKRADPRSRMGWGSCEYKNSIYDGKALHKEAEMDTARGAQEKLVKQV